MGSYYSNGRNEFLTMDAASKTQTLSYGAVGFRIGAIQVTYGTKEGFAADKYYVQPGNIIKFALTKLVITYYCR